MEEFFSEEDKNNAAYVACVSSQTLIGGAVGSLVSAGTLAPVGFAAGLLFGVLTCPKLKPAIKKKLFGNDTQYQEDELAQIVDVMKEVRQEVSTKDALNVIYNANSIIASNPERYIPYV